MQDFEERAVTTAPLKPSLWFSYVDDPFVTWKHVDRELQSFLEWLNVQCTEVQFTMEENEGSIPFLGVYVNKDGSKLSVYRKSTHTDRYLHYTAHTTIQRWSLVLQIASITELNEFAHGDLPWRKKKGSACSWWSLHGRNVLQSVVYWYCYVIAHNQFA